MFDTWTDENKETKQGLKVWYSYDTNFWGKVVNDKPSMQSSHIVRHISKQYSYVGLTEEAAKNCVNAKTAQYSKTLKGWYFDGSDNTFKIRNVLQVVAEIVANHVAGHMWEVQINVNQTDDYWTKGEPPSDLSKLFGAIVPSDYDE